MLVVTCEDCDFMLHTWVFDLSGLHPRNHQMEYGADVEFALCVCDSDRLLMQKAFNTLLQFGQAHRFSHI